MSTNKLGDNKKELTLCYFRPADDLWVPSARLRQIFLKNCPLASSVRIIWRSSRTSFAEFIKNSQKVDQVDAFIVIGDGFSSLLRSLATEKRVPVLYIHSEEVEEEEADGCGLITAHALEASTAVAQEAEKVKAEIEAQIEKFASTMTGTLSAPPQKEGDAEAKQKELEGEGGQQASSSSSSSKINDINRIDVSLLLSGSNIIKIKNEGAEASSHLAGLVAGSSSTADAKEGEKELIKQWISDACVDANEVNLSVVQNINGSSFIKECEAKKGDYHAAIRDETDFYQHFEALVVIEEATMNENRFDGDIVYALYEKHIPVLHIVVVSPTTTIPKTPRLENKLLTTRYVVSSAKDGEGNETKEEEGDKKEDKAPTSAVSRVSAQIEDHVKEFFTFPAQQGRIIVVEGGDGSGKQTQVKLLHDRLVNEGYRAETLDYPHDAADYGVLIRELLSGKMGKINEVNPLLFAALYGLNRHATLPLLKYWVQRGANVILDRYMTANFGHQASKYEKDEDRINAINTLRNFELKWLSLPDADKVFYLNLPPDFALRAMQADKTRRELDIHERASVDYKNNVRKSFLWCCDTFSEQWKEIRCVDEKEEERFSREHVHAEIYANVLPLLRN